MFFLYRDFLLFKKNTRIFYSVSKIILFIIIILKYIFIFQIKDENKLIIENKTLNQNGLQITVPKISLLYLSWISSRKILLLWPIWWQCFLLPESFRFISIYVQYYKIYNWKSYLFLSDNWCHFKWYLSR